MSGIDDQVSTALGLAAGSGRATAALIGDLATYHDMNGLLAAAPAAARSTVVEVMIDRAGSTAPTVPTGCGSRAATGTPAGSST